MNMKQTCTTLLVLLLTVGLFSCGTAEGTSSVPAGTETETAVTASDTEQQIEAETAVTASDTEPQTEAETVPMTEQTKTDEAETTEADTEAAETAYTGPNATCEMTWEIRSYQSPDEMRADILSDEALADYREMPVYALSGLPEAYQPLLVEWTVGSSYTVTYMRDSIEDTVSFSAVSSLTKLDELLGQILETDGTPEGLQRNDLLRNFRITEEETPWGVMQITVYDTSVKTDMKTTYLDFTDEAGIRRVLIRSYYADETLWSGKLFVFDPALPLRFQFNAPLDTEVLFSLSANPIS